MRQRKFVFLHTLKIFLIAGQRRALALFAALIAAALLCHANTAWAWNCTAGWKSAYDDVSGRGTASIAHQCRPDEHPCPPQTELQRRAVEAARVMALADAEAKHASSVYQSSETERGRVSTFSTSAAGGNVYDIEYCTQITGDTAEVRLVGAKW
jgi:uncharacterized protein YggE